MSFASPLMLLGLLLLGPLVWLHLKRRPHRTIAFPTLFILQRVLRRQQKKSQVRQWLLLVVRALIVVSFTVALSRPSLTVWRPGGIRSGLPLSQVILLDNSASMQRQMQPDEESTAFERARKMALTEIGRLRPQDSVAVILCAKPPQLLTDGLTTDKELAAASLAGQKAGYAADAVDEALVKAERLLASSTSAQKEVLLITDLSAKPPAPESLKNLRAVFRVTGVSPSTDFTANTAVTNVEVLPSGGQEAREVIVSAEITNFGSSKQKIDVELTLDGKPVARSLLSLGPKQTGVKKFHHRFDSKGIHFGQVKIGDDFFLADNIRHLATNIRRSVSVLVINGDSRPGSYLNETFYLQKALETALVGEVPIRTQIMDPESVRVTPLEGFDVILMAGVTDLPPSTAERVIRFVEDGGGLFVAAGNGKLSDRLQAVLPADVEGIRKSDRKKFFTMGAMELSHPVFMTLHAETTGLESVQITSHLLFKPNPTVARTVLMQLHDGLPLLLERKVNKGTVLLLATTVDRDWTDLPIRPGFLPLIQRSVRYLSKSLSHREPRKIDVGSAISLPVVEGMQKLIVLSPPQKRTVLAANKLTGQTNVRFSKTAFPGAYRIWAEMPGFGGLSELPSSAFVVNVSVSESDLSPRMKESGEVSRDDRDMYTALKGKLPIWSHLLLAGILLLILEGFLSGLGLRKSHQKASL